MIILINIILFIYYIFCYIREIFCSSLPLYFSRFIVDFFRLNKNVVVEKHRTQLSSSNALQIIKQYDIVIDATDNVATRYLLNDACVLLAKPLVSGAAVKTEGQLTVYGYAGGPCYRCLFPNPPPSQSVANCGDVGVLPHGN